MEFFFFVKISLGNMFTKLRYGMKRFSTSSVQGKLSLRPNAKKPKRLARRSNKETSTSSPSAQTRVRAPIRACATQAHTRMKCDNIEVVPIAVAREDLISSSVKTQSMVQYDSRLRTLAKFLGAARQSTSNDVLSCTKEEFFCFLYNRKRQKMGPAGTTRSALLKLHDMNGIHPSFLRDQDTILAVEGAGANCPHVDKAVLSPDQRDVFLEALLHGPEVALGSCALCKKNGREADFRLRLQIEAEFMWEVPIRLTDAGHLRHHDFINTKKPRCVFVEGLKTAPHGGYIIVNDDGWELFEAAAERSTNDFLFPKCGAQHLGAVVQWCQRTYEWEPGLAWVAYTMRHTGMNKREKKVEAAVSELIHNVTRPVSRLYARDNSARRKKE